MEQQPQLKKALSARSLFAIGLGCVVGWSWIVYAGLWTTKGGSLGGIIAFVITGALCSLIGLIYAELTSAYPKVGGDLVFTLEGIGNGASIAMSWMLLAFWVGLTMIETMFFPIIMTRLGIPVPTFGQMYSIGGNPVYFSYLLVSLAMNGLLGFVNSRSVEVSGKVQQLMVWIMLAAVVFFLLLGFIKGSPSNAQPLFTNGAGFLAVFLMLPGFMSGFNSIAQAAEEGNVSPKIIGRAVILTIWGAVFFYVAVCVGLAFGGDVTLRSGETLVVLDAVDSMTHGSTIAMFFVTFASLLGMVTTWNACYIAASRLFVGLSRAKYLPAGLQKVNEKTKAPDRAIWLLFGLSSMIVFFGCNPPIYVGIIDVFSFGLVISWILVSISYLRLNKNRPELARPYRVKYPKLVGWAGLLFSIAFLYLYMPWAPAPLTNYEWMGAIAVAIIALIVYFTYNRRKGYVSLDERRHLLGLDEFDKKVLMNLTRNNSE